MDDVQKFYQDAGFEAWFWDEMNEGLASVLLNQAVSEPFVTWWLEWYGPPSFYHASASKTHNYWAMCAAACVAWFAGSGVIIEEPCEL